MKIALFHNLPSGGAKRAVYEWVCRLAGDHTIDAYSLDTADHSFCDIRPFVSEYNIYEFSTRELYQPPFGRLNQLQRWRDLGDLQKLHRKIAGDINAGGYDVLFANPCLFTFIPAFIQYIRIPSVYYLHEPFGREKGSMPDRPYLLKRNWQSALDRFDPFIRLYHNRLDAIQTAAVNKTALLLANSHFTAERTRTAFGREATVCQLGVDVDAFYPVQGASREEFLLSVGEMSYRKGFDFIIESLGKLPAHRRPALKLACNVIKPEELAFITDLARRWGIELEVLSRLDVEKLRDYYSRARLCVYTPVREPFGLVPLEAMACGTPVVGIREGGVPESIVHEFTGLLVERDAERFASAIHSLMSDPDRLEAYGRNGREHVVRNWNWDRSVSLLDSQLRRACRN